MTRKVSFDFDDRSLISTEEIMDCFPDFRPVVVRAKDGTERTFFIPVDDPRLECNRTQLSGPRDRGYQDPFSHRAEEIAHRAITRADVQGIRNYGPAPAPLEETRDMIQEAIEELLDAIYYQIRQVARLEDLRSRLGELS